MEEILHLKNEYELSQLENKLNELDIEYFIKKTDSNIFPHIFAENYYAILFSDIKNRDLINEIYVNLKSTEIDRAENNENVYDENNIKYCSHCGKKLIESVEMCDYCGALIFVKEKPKINNRPSKIISILSFLLPLIGIVIATFCENSDERKKYRNCALVGFFFYIIISLINRCIVNEEYSKLTDQFIEEIHNREKE
jgi:DNA-directed RNA polymerase subunit RPC12/RpoP